LNIDTLYLQMRDGQKIDTALVKNNEFTFKGTVTSPMEVELTSSKRNTMAFATIFLENAKIEVAGMVGTNRQPDISVAGTLANEGQTSYIKKVIELFTNLQLTTKEEQKAFGEKYAALRDSLYNVHKDNLFGVSLLNEISFTWQPSKTLEVVAALPADMQATDLAQTIKSNAEKKLRTEVGNPYIDIVMPDKDGNNIALSDVLKKNKYVLLDFWASWCGPCMGEVPNLLKAYAQFHDKGFEIYGVSLDNPGQKDRWLGAIEKHKMEWVQVSELKGWETASPKEYGVTGIPASFIIESATGKIVASNLRGDELITKLGELLGE
jgi:peroxiredoxin